MVPVAERCERQPGKSRVSSFPDNFSATKSSSESTKSRGEPGVGFSSASGEFRDDWSMLVE